MRKPIECSLMNPYLVCNTHATTGCCMTPGEASVGHPLRLCKIVGGSSEKPL